MKKVITIMYCLLIGVVNAQTVDYLEHNNTRATLPSSRSFFNNPITNEAGYEVPVGSGNHAVYVMRLQFMGKDSSGNLYGALGGDANSGTDVFSGPYASTGIYDSIYQAKWNNRTWQICQEEIDTYREWWEACEGPNADPLACVTLTAPSNEIITKLFEWPAHGNVQNGEEYFLAPYFDHPASVQGIYDPSGGDYPIIKGCCANYRIDNDAAGLHTYSGMDPIGVETHYQTFQYANWGLLNDVTFVEVTVHNRGTRTYPEFVYGMFVDSQLGDFSDDYIGSDSTRNMYYTYNADNNDVQYGNNPPAFGVVALESPLSSVIQFNGGLSPAEIWNQMNGFQASGQPILMPSGSPTKFTYGENPNVPAGWSEVGLGNVPGDRRGFLSTEHGSFAPGDVIQQTYAFVYVQEGNHLQNVDALYAAADEVHNFYDTLASAQCENGVLSVFEESELISFGLMPNPASNEITIAMDASTLFTATIFDASGKKLNQQEGQGTMVLKTASLMDGIYLVEVRTETNVLTKRLLIAR